MDCSLLGSSVHGIFQARILEWVSSSWGSFQCSAVQVAQSCPILCDPMDCTVHGILQARILEWVAFPFSRASSQPRDWTQVSHIVGRFFTSWATREAWGILSNLGSNLGLWCLLHWQADYLPLCYLVPAGAVVEKTPSLLLFSTDGAPGRMMAVLLLKSFNSQTLLLPCVPEDQFFPVSASLPSAK